MKGSIRIGGALVVGIGIILGALYMSNQSLPTTPTLSDTSLGAPGTGLTRDPIAIHDTDSDGIADWEETLQETVFRFAPTPTSTSLFAPSATYTPPPLLRVSFLKHFWQITLMEKWQDRILVTPHHL